MRKMILGTLVIFALAGRVLAQDLATIQAHNDRFLAALSAGDMDAVAQMYAEDARLYPPGAKMVQGRDAIKAFWTSAAAGIAEAKLTAVDVKPLGDSNAREVGTLTLKTKGENPQEITGKYIVIWQKVGDEWKLADDIWNTDK